MKVYEISEIRNVGIIGHGSSGKTSLTSALLFSSGPVNKLDRENASFARAVESITRAFGRQAVPLQIPIGSEKMFAGVVDLVTEKAWVYDRDESGRNTIADVPADLAGDAEQARDRLMEAVAEVGGAPMEAVFEKGALSQDDLVAGLSKGVKERKIFPVLCASALANIR